MVKGISVVTTCSMKGETNKQTNNLLDAREFQVKMESTLKSNYNVYEVEQNGKDCSGYCPV